MDIIRRVLVKEYKNIFCATNWKEALLLTEEVKPDLILQDISIPEMNGFAIYEKIKEQNLSPDTIVIYLTSSRETQDIIRGFDLGAVDYITKPINTYEILLRVRNHLEFKKSRDIVKKQNEKIKLLNAIFKKESKSKEEIEAKKREMESTIKTLRHQISELERIDHKLQNKRKTE